MKKKEESGFLFTALFLLLLSSVETDYRQNLLMALPTPA